MPFGLSRNPNCVNDIAYAVRTGQIDMFHNDTYFSFVFPDNTIYAVRKDYLALPLDQVGEPLSTSMTASQMFMNATLLLRADKTYRC